MDSIPGPRGLPIIGNIHQLGAELHLSLTEMSREYGEVFCVRLGRQPMVILNGRNAIKQALIVQTTDFAGRPEHVPTLRAVNCLEGGMLSCMTYDEKWKFYHKLFVAAFQEFTDGDNKEISERHTLEEATKFVDFVLTKEPSAIFSADALINRAVVNLNNRFLFSSHHELDDPFMIKFVELQEELWSSRNKCNPINALPWLDQLMPGKLSKFKANTVRQFELLRTLIDESNKEYVEGSKINLLHFMKTQRSSLDQHGVEYSEEKLESLILGNFQAAASLFATLNWAFVYAIKFPELQKEVQDEIDGIVGRERAPTWSDRESLPLTEAFLHEVMRHAPVVPVTLLHYTIRDTVLGGGFNVAIPEGTIVLGNLHSVFYDQKEWEDPDQFNPKRFLKDNGKSLDIDKIESLMHFGGGVRMCLGRKIAMLQIFLFFAAVMHRCTLKNVEGQNISMKCVPFQIGMRPQATKIALVQR